MKTNHWIGLAAAVFLSLGAREIRADAQPDAPAGKAPKTAPQAPKSKPVEKALSEGVTNAGPATVRVANANIRASAAILSEVIGKVKRGEKVEVLEVIELKKPKADEPATWAKIHLPATTPVWVSALFVDTNLTVKATKLNLRSGPGENHAILGSLAKGATVKELEKKDNWLRIEPPTSLQGYVAAHLLEADAPAVPVVTPPPPPPPPPTPEPVPTNAIVVVPPVPPPTPEPMVNTNVVPPPVPPPAVPVIIPPPSTELPPPPKLEDVLVKRVVTREGVVKRSVSIQAPTYFVLESLENKRVINYIFSPTTNIVVKDFKGARVIVTGEESLDERWRTPVLSVQSLQVVE